MCSMNKDITNLLADWKPVPLGKVAQFSINNPAEICLCQSWLPAFLSVFPSTFPYPLSAVPGFPDPDLEARGAPIGRSELLSSDEEMVRGAVHLNWRSGNLGYRLGLVTIQICDSGKPCLYSVT